MNQSERRQILLRALLDEKPAWRQAGIPAQAGEQKQVLRGLMNVREAAPLDPALLAIQDAYLTAETQAKGITDCRDAAAPGMCPPDGRPGAPGTHRDRAADPGL